MIYFISAFLLAFITTVLILPKTIWFLKNVGITGIDIQKKDKPTLAEMGGLPVLIGFLAGGLLYVAFITFLTTSGNALKAELLGAILTIMIITLIGMLDDISTLLGRNIKQDDKSFKRVGFKQRHKFIMPLAAAIPLVVLNSGTSTMVLPFIGSVNFGLIYPLILIPLGIFGASNATNMLAGMNGLEAGLGTVLLSFLGVYAYLHGASLAAAISMIFVGALLAFLLWNWYPAKIMPGDSLAYTIGAVAAITAIVGNIEKFAVFLFIPWFIELILKARTGFSAENFGGLQKDGTLKCKYDKNYSLTHVVMHLGRFSEKQIVLILIGFEIIIGIIGLIII
ncbi:MAG: hypothetical protein K0B02_00760 [DPANN group archaeon]|nr:hypothetical protein [DPANN group archaeon]